MEAVEQVWADIFPGEVLQNVRGCRLHVSWVVYRWFLVTHVPEVVTATRAIDLLKGFFCKSGVRGDTLELFPEIIDNEAQGQNTIEH